jgi:hypothetical protein
MDWTGEEMKNIEQLQFAAVAAAYGRLAVYGRSIQDDYPHLAEDMRATAELLKDAFPRLAAALKSQG